MKIIILYASFLLGVSLGAAPLEIGKPAPDFEHLNWVKKGPVKLADGKGKNIYVIECWATWCPPCRMAIPHLSEIQKKYKNKGVVVVAITREDLSTVDSFVKGQDNMDYNVAADPEGTTYNTYMDGLQGIPYAFIVDRNGLLVWSGHPLQMDAVLESVIDGTFDPVTAEKTIKLQKELMEAVQNNDMDRGLYLAKQLLFLTPNNAKLLQMISYMFKAKRHTEEAKEFFDKLITAHPDKEQPYLAKFRLLVELNDKKEAVTLVDRYLEQFNDNATKLNSIAWILTAETPLRMRLPAKALAAAKQSVKITSPNDKMLTGAHLDTLARCYYSVGRLDKAVETETKAAALITNGEEGNGISEILDFYKEAMRVGNSEK